QFHPQVAGAIRAVPQEIREDLAASWSRDGQMCQYPEALASEFDWLSAVLQPYRVSDKQPQLSISFHVKDPPRSAPQDGASAWTRGGPCVRRQPQRFACLASRDYSTSRYAGL